MKHIAYIIDTFPAVSETFILNEILELQKRGWKIDIYSLNKPEGDITHPGAKALAKNTVYINDSFPIGSTWGKLKSLLINPIAYLRNVEYAKDLPDSYQWIATQCIALANAIKRSGCSRVHAHFAAPAAQWAMMVSHYAGLPYTVTTHGSDIFIRPLPSVNRLLGDAEKVVTVSNFNKQYMMRHFNLSEEQIMVIPCGVDTEKFRPNSEIKRVPGLLLTVARLAPVKGLVYLVEAAKQLRDNGVDFRLCIIGEGKERDLLEQKINNYNLRDKIVLLGARTSDFVRKSMSECQVFVLPSLSEGLPVAYMEAMATGCPIVGTDVMGVKELVRDGIVGYLVPAKSPDALAEKITLLLNESERAKKFSDNARNIIENEFSLKGQVDRLIKMWSTKIDQ